MVETNVGSYVVGLVRNSGVIEADADSGVVEPVTAVCEAKGT